MKWKHIFILLLLIPAISGFSQGKYTISGVILDSESGDALNGVDIVVKDQNTGTISNAKGLFLLHLEEGQHKLTISGKGYGEKEFNIDLNGNMEKEFSLNPSKGKEKKPLKKKEKKNFIHSTLLSLL